MKEYVKNIPVKILHMRIKNIPNSFKIKERVKNIPRFGKTCACVLKIYKNSFKIIS